MRRHRKGSSKMISRGPRTRGLRVLSCPKARATPAPQSARKKMLERRLAHWVQRANRQQGVAPTTSMVLDVAEAQRMADPPADELRPHGAAHEGRARMWAWRWRRRWGGRFGVIPSREPLTMPDMRSKVQPWGRTLAQFWSELGP